MANLTIYNSNSNTKEPASCQTKPLPCVPPSGLGATIEIGFMHRSWMKDQGIADY